MIAKDFVTKPVEESRGQTESQSRRTYALRTALAPLMPFLDNDGVVEIMLNADGAVWIEEVGKGMYRSTTLIGPVEAERMLRLIASEVKIELNATSPTLSAKLPAPWGARVQASIPPVVSAPIFAMRKPARVLFTLDDYVTHGIVTEPQRDALVRAVHARENILIGGGTGSGKTTFANALLSVITQETSDRIYIVEDTPELRCMTDNKLEILVDPKIHTWQQAVMAAMRFRPDRILVGEVRDGSALELLKAWNTGHPGGLATVHANDTRAMLDRLCQLIEEIVYPAPRALVAQTINLCVHIRRDTSHPSGRSVSGIDRVAPRLGPEGAWLLEPIT